LRRRGRGDEVLPGAQRVHAAGLIDSVTRSPR
jgi:hypothetical protein